MNYTIEYRDLSYKAYLQIKAMILNGHIRPGEKIAQENIARELGISRMPLHKAFQMLENELLVEYKPRRGMYVKEIDLEEIADAFECREAIEGVAAKRTAKTISDQDIDYLTQLFKPFAEDPSGADLLRYQEADHLFHKKIIGLSNNRILSRMEMLGNILLNTYRKGLIRPPAETISEHFAIIDAFRLHDGLLAEKLIKNHFTASRQVVLKRIETDNSEKTKQ